MIRIVLRKMFYNFLEEIKSRVQKEQYVRNVEDAHSGFFPRTYLPTLYQEAPVGKTRPMEEEERKFWRKYR